MQLSIVTTLYHSAPFVKEFYERACSAAESITPNYEIIFVNDGSPDQSLANTLALIPTNPRVRVVDLSRNFGHHQAIMAGLSQTAGDRVFLIDADLEESPEWLAKFWKEMDEADLDVVVGVQELRGGSWFARWSGTLFYKVFNLFSDTKIVENQMTVRLMRREYVKELLQIRDRNLFLGGTMTWVGFRQGTILLQKKHRPTGSTYTLARRMTLFLNAIASFSSYPLRLVFVTGVLISALAGISGFYLLLDKILHPEAVLLGYASLIVSVWFLGGLTILFLGVIGIYLAKIFVEVKPRPPYVIRRIHSARSAENSTHPPANG